jgi:hypothetical protein
MPIPEIWRNTSGIYSVTSLWESFPRLLLLLACRKRFREHTKIMTAAELLILARAYSEETGLSLNTIGERACASQTGKRGGNNKLFVRLAEGHGPGRERLHAPSGESAPHDRRLPRRRHPGRHARRLQHPPVGAVSAVIQASTQAATSTGTLLGTRRGGPAGLERRQAAGISHTPSGRRASGHPAGAGSRRAAPPAAAFPLAALPAACVRRADG